MAPDVAGPLPRSATDSASGPRGTPSAAVRQRFTIALFRLLTQYRATYDVRYLEWAETLCERHASSVHAGPTDADAAMAAAIRLDNEMRCQAVTDFAAGLPGSAGRTDAEGDFLALIEAVAERDDRAAAMAATRLSVGDRKALTACIQDFLGVLCWTRTPAALVTRATTTMTKSLTYSRAQATNMA